VSEVLGIPGSDDVVVMLDYLGSAGVADNLRRITSDRDIIWQASAPGPAPDGWDEIELAEASVDARSRSGWTLTFDLETGQELSRGRFR